MLFEIANIAVKCSRSIFLKAIIQTVLERNFLRFSNFCAEYKILNTSTDQGTLEDTKY